MEGQAPRKDIVMNRYLAEMHTPETVSEEFIALIPSQWERVVKLMQAGMIASYALALDRSKLWVVFSADTETEALQLLGGLPLTRFMRTELHPLAFHEVGDTRSSQLIMN
jgi:muconolactone delta-isomerase